MIKKKIVLLCPSYEVGGIERTISSVIQVLEASNRLTIVRLRKRNAFFAKIRFLAEAVLAISKSDLCICFHVNLLFPKVLFSGKRLLVFLHGLELWDRIDFPSHWNYVVNSKMNYFFLKGFNQQLLVNQLYYPGMICPQNVLATRTDSQGVLRFLLVSRISFEEPYKNIERCARVFSAMEEKGISVRLTIVGDGSGRADLEQKYGSTNVDFQRFAQDDALADLYSLSDVFVLPSSREGQGLVFLEALGFGIPVIGLKQTVAEEFISHAKNGFLIDDSDLALEQQVVYCVENRDMILSMRKNALDRSKELNVENIFRRRMLELVSL